MTRTRRWTAAGLAAVLLGLPLAGQDPRFSGQLTIREREILVDVPDLLAEERLVPGDFQVLVDGQPREVTRTEPAAGDWTTVIYVDRVLASPGTVFYSGLALANHTRDLTRLGTVEVAVASSDPRVAVAPTREAEPLQQVLTDLAAEARVERDRSEGRAAAGPSPLQIRRQLDKLLAFLTARRPTGPHAVFLVMDGLDLSPEEIAALGSEAPAEPGTPAGAFRLLAAYGWIAIPVPLRKEGIGTEIAPQSEIEIFRQSSAPSKHQSGVPPILPGRPPQKTTLAFPGVIDLFIAPKTAVLRILSQATAGTVIGFEEQIGPTLAALSQRWRIWIVEPDAPVDGRLHSIAVSLSTRMKVDVPFGSIAVGPARKVKQVRAPEWIRSSTPEGIAEARLENLLAGHPADGDLPLTAVVRRTPAGLELSIEVPPLQLPGSTPSSPVRISYAFPEEEGAAVHHETLPGGDLEKGWRRTLIVAPLPGSRQIAVVVDALGPERWTGKVLAIGI
jgi:hypothetical protein